VRTLVVGTRGSDLALAQTEYVVQSLSKKNDRVEFSQKIIKTSGDEGGLVRPKTTGKDAFTREIDLALLDSKIDLAVHSLKDLPIDNRADSDPKIEIVSFPPRESPFDVLISKSRRHTIDTLPKGSRIGTSSVRRSIQLKSYRPDFTIVEVHGNVPTRIRKLRSGDLDLDGLVLAEAGLNRLGIQSEIDEVISPEIVLPAVGQGALAITARSNDSFVKSIARSIDDYRTRQCVSAERRFSEEFGGGCNTPIAALATMNRDRTVMRIVGVASRSAEYSLNENEPLVREKISGPAGSPARLGRRLARKLKKSIGTV
jgi:hydroxymethylbilane synthase